MTDSNARQTNQNRRRLKDCLLCYRVLFKNAGTLATELTEARDGYQLGKIERQMEKTYLLCIFRLNGLRISLETV